MIAILLSGLNMKQSMRGAMCPRLPHVAHICTRHPIFALRLNHDSTHLARSSPKVVVYAIPGIGQEVSSGCFCRGHVQTKKVAQKGAQAGTRLMDPQRDRYPQYTQDLLLCYALLWVLLPSGYG